MQIPMWCVMPVFHRSVRAQEGIRLNYYNFHFSDLERVLLSGNPIWIDALFYFSTLPLFFESFSLFGRSTSVEGAGRLVFAERELVLVRYPEVLVSGSK